jgi:hypothetical protein
MNYLPVTPIVPGARVQLALQQITDAENELSQEVMNSGNVIAALVAIGPQLLLAQSVDAEHLAGQHADRHASGGGLGQHPDRPPGVPAQPAGDHDPADPSDAGLVGAALLLPLVNLLGVATSATQSLVGQAHKRRG